MAMSMTGYGREVIPFKESTITVEIRSVNHRFLDISSKIPRFLLVIEDKIKKVVQSHFERGRIDVFITVDGKELAERELQVNWDLMDQYINSLKEIKSRYNIEGDIPIHTITRLEDLFTIQETEQGFDTMHETILSIVDKTCHQVLNMREKEGKELTKDLRKRINLIENTIKKLGERREVVIIEYRERILDRLKQYLNEEIRSDESKIYQDVAILAEKGDIVEEVTRLQSHTKQFLQTLEQAGAVGRKLDFILQEMHRETNTIGSKSNDVQISEWVVMLKSEMERVKEQIQNVE